MGVYLLKSSIALLVFLAYYWFVLRRDTTFQTNRIYLISSLIISVLIPLLEINWKVESQALQAVNNAVAPIHIQFDTEVASQEQTSWWTLSHILISVYVFGALAVLIKYIRQIIPWVRLVPKGDSRKNPIQIVKTDKAIPPFSFVNTIFLGNQEFNDSELNKIISHEKQHIIQHHWIDLLVVDILSILFWFNPLVWIYDLLIKQNHEYLADNGVIAQGFNKSSYQALLLQQVVGVKIPGLSSSFTQSLIKNRFIMMTKKHSRKITGIKALFALPILLFLTVLFAGNTNSAYDSNINAAVEKGKITGHVYDITTGKPLPGSSIIFKEDCSQGTVSDNDGYFELVNPFEKAHLLISYVGFETEMVEINKKKVKILMRRATIPVNLTEKEVKGGIAYKVDDAPPPPPPPAKKEKNDLPPPPPPKDKKEGEKVVTPPPPPPSVKEGESMLVVTQQDEGEIEMFHVVEDMPEPYGGFKGLSQFISMETSKYKDLYKGLTISIFFVVNEKGVIEDVKVIKSSENSDADYVAMGIVEHMPKWKPGFQRGKNVPVDFTIDIKF